ncbi:MAG TPA: hypothetical protein VIX15_03545 [Streptosporangiaceae bacterium]
MAVEADITAPLFAPPSIAAGRADAGDGSLLLRSTGPLGDYPVTVVHSVRAWATADPAHPLVAERSQAGDWRVCSYGEAVAAADAIGPGLANRAALVDLLYAEPAPPGVIVAEGDRS